LDRGIVLVAQNNGEHDYVEQATALAMSLKKHNNVNVSIITDDYVTPNQREYFDQVLPISWGDMADGKTWKIENRWKVFYQTPYKETIVMDTDMLVMRNIDHLWDFYSNYDLFFTTSPVTYRNEKLTSLYYREIFEKNKLPNIYSALYYFKRTPFSHNFFSFLECVVKDFDSFQELLCPNMKQESLSMDVAIAMAIQVADIEDKVTNKNSDVSTFVHMKPYAQNWRQPRSSWQHTVNSYFTNDLELYVGNYKQEGIFHYTEKDFLDNANIIDKLESSEDE